ncbi:MAG: hypothetical protein U5J96_17235 [Ignavibacteriaceae bacterium]|nr:hypothetical protein [Ignavibacteriaceae bacterium]
MKKKRIINRNEYSPSSSLLELTQLHKIACRSLEENEEKIFVKILDRTALKIWNLKKKVMMKIDVQRL